jgi:hypothetical protein
MRKRSRWAEWGDDALASATGTPRYNRRLGDKVLSALNHSYAVGAIDIAAQLREILARIESDRIAERGERRDSATTLGQADLWMTFVEARNDYEAACSAGEAGTPAADAALAAMKTAYEAWLNG